MAWQRSDEPAVVPAGAVTPPGVRRAEVSPRWLRTTPARHAGSSLAGTENFRAYDHGGAVPGERQTRAAGNRTARNGIAR